MNIILIQTGQTTWEVDARIESATGAPLTDAGIETAERITRELAEENLKCLYACPSEAAQQTAQLIAKGLGVKRHADDAIGELDFGLWQGLTVEEIKRRQPKLYKQWADDPSITCPPSGETVQDAQDRIRQRIKDLAKKPKNTPVGLILRPVSAGLLRCLMAGASLSDLWQYVQPSFTWVSFDIDPDQL